MDREWWKVYTRTCTFSHDPLEFAPIGNQLSSGGCMAFSLVTLVNHYFAKHRMFRIFSEQHLMDVFHNRKPDVKDVLDYVSLYGLLTSDAYPLSADCSSSDFRMPVPPVVISCAKWDLHPHPLFEHVIRLKPIASLFLVTQSYINWVGSGCTGVFTYETFELGWVSDFHVYGEKYFEEVSSHMVVLLGFGVEGSERFFLVRDSQGTSINAGYRKMTAVAFNIGYSVNEARSFMSNSRDCETYRAMKGFRPPPQVNR